MRMSRAKPYYASACFEISIFQFEFRKGILVGMSTIVLGLPVPPKMLSTVISTLRRTQLDVTSLQAKLAPQIVSRTTAGYPFFESSE